MANVSHIGAYFTNPTPEMEAFCVERLKELLSGKREHASMETEFSYIKKDCPNAMSAENIKKIMSELTEAEKCKAVDVIARDAVLLDKSKGMLIEIISAIESTEAYKKASDPLNDEPSKEEQRLLKDMREAGIKL